MIWNQLAPVSNEQSGTKRTRPGIGTNLDCGVVPLPPFNPRRHSTLVSDCDSTRQIKAGRPSVMTIGI